MSYLTYAEYQEYGGTLDEATFNNLEFQAEVQIDWFTFNRLQNDTTVSVRVKRCVCMLIDLINNKMIATALPDVSGGTQSTMNASIASQSNDGVSISYNVVSASQIVEKFQDDIKQCILLGLQGVKNEAGKLVTWRGIYPDE